ncbi:endolytic transglycosylase MltG [Candidatus Parcubacteria bacterium]|nr:MAG: endolytic transglycosylase MltG [Candidatus Parcubacteria bacterium]
MRFIKLIFVLSVLAAFVFGHFLFTILKQKDLTEPQTIKIESGEGLNSISSLLESEGIIDNRAYFKLTAFLVNADRALKAGIYNISGPISIYDLIKLLSGNDHSDIVLTIPEGFSIKDIEEKIKEISGETIDLNNFKIRDFKGEFTFLASIPGDRSLEGFLFPDTYRLRPNFEPQDFIKKALTNFEAKLTQELRDEIKNQKKGLYEIITMASLIEKEVPDHNEQKIVSGVLWKRFEAGVALQVDATIAFILNKKTSKILLEDLKVPSPYNTYLNRGLPPGPIANPGISAIMAAVFPEKSPYWYYLSKPTGETVFSKTLDEHNEAKARYLR